MRSPVSGDLLLSLAGFSGPRYPPQRDLQALAILLEQDCRDECSNAVAAPVWLSPRSSTSQRLTTCW
jgi:hypothetical protein